MLFVRLPSVHLASLHNCSDQLSGSAIWVFPMYTEKPLNLLMPYSQWSSWETTQIHSFYCHVNFTFHDFADFIDFFWCVIGVWFIRVSNGIKQFTLRSIEETVGMFAFTKICKINKCNFAIFSGISFNFLDSYLGKSSWALKMLLKSDTFNTAIKNKGNVALLCR